MAHIYEFAEDGKLLPPAVQDSSTMFTRLFVRGPQDSASFQLCWCTGQGILLCPGLELGLLKSYSPHPCSQQRYKGFKNG
jgi:hypothetical protein